MTLLIFFIAFVTALFSSAVVTSDGYGTHVTTPGENMFGINHDGVVQVLSSVNNASGCSGVLLAGGKHVLTAGHCVANKKSIWVRFHLPSGVVHIEAESWAAHPDYGVIQGSDVGVITLTQRAPLASIFH